MTDDPNVEPPRGIFDSLRALLDTVVSILHNRAELLTTELEEELRRLIGVALWALAGVLSLIIGASLVAIMVILAIPDQWRVLIAGGLGLVFLVVAVIGFVSVRKILRAKPRPFDATLRELEKDRDHLRGRK
jgi:uncharacterized membrane protein YqjE